MMGDLNVMNDRIFITISIKERLRYTKIAK